MGRLIDANRLKAHYCWWEGGSREMTIDEAKKTFDNIIDVQPTVDAEPVVRCQDCKYWEYDVIFSDGWCRGKHQGNPSWFCADGERREDANNR